jgi:hypothetical protein
MAFTSNFAFYMQLSLSFPALQLANWLCVAAMQGFACPLDRYPSGKASNGYFLLWSLLNKTIYFSGA